METQDLTKRQIQAINTKNKIYETAVELITTKGYDNVSLTEICKNAGVSVGGFYHHYHSKYDILVEIFKKGNTYIENQFEDFDKTSKYSLDMIREMIKFEMIYASDIGVDLVRQLYKNEMQAENKFLISGEHTFLEKIETIVVQGKEKHEIRTDMTNKEIMNYIIRFSRGIIYDWCLHEGDFDVVAFSNESFEKFIKIFMPQSK